MTRREAQQRSWTILRLRGAYHVLSRIAYGMNYNPTILRDEIETMLLRLGAETEATRSRLRDEELAKL